MNLFNVGVSRLVFILSVLLAGQMILLIVFQNLFFPLNTYYFYFFGFSFLVIIYKPWVYFNKMFMPVWFFFALYWLLFNLYVYESNIATYNVRWLYYNELSPLFVAILFYVLWIRDNALKELKYIIRVTLIFVFITSITSIIGLNKFPDAARLMAGRLGVLGDYETLDMFNSLGIGGYDFFYGMAFAFPVIMFLLRKHWSNARIRYAILVFIAIVFYAIIKSQHTTAILYSVINIVFGAIGFKRLRTTFIAWFILVSVVLFVPNQFYADTLKSIAESLKGETLSDRIYDLGVLIELAEEETLEESDTHFGRRAERIPFLIDQFSQSPIIGGGESTGHVFWLDRLSLFGLIGLIPWVVILVVFFRKSTSIIKSEMLMYFLLSLFSFITVGFMKNSGGKLVYYFNFFIVPAILYLYSNNKDLFSKKERIVQLPPDIVSNETTSKTENQQ